MNTSMTMVKTRSADPTGRVPVEDALAYLDFFYGLGAGRGVDLGPPQGYTRVPAAGERVFRADFQRGIALCNGGEETAVVELAGPYRDRDGVRRCAVTVPAKAVVVLFAEPPMIPRQPTKTAPPMISLSGA